MEIRIYVEVQPNPRQLLYHLYHNTDRRQVTDWRMICHDNLVFVIILDMLQHIVGKFI